MAASQTDSCSNDDGAESPFIFTTVGSGSKAPTRQRTWSFSTFKQNINESLVKMKAKHFLNKQLSMWDEPLTRNSKSGIGCKELANKIRKPEINAMLTKYCNCSLTEPMKWRQWIDQMITDMFGCFSHQAENSIDGLH